MAKDGPAKDDLEAKRVEPKSNQSALPAAAMETVRAASKPAVVVDKKMSRGFRSHRNKGSGLLNQKGSDP